MTNVAAIPALAIVAGCVAGVYVPVPVAVFVVCAVTGWIALSARLVCESARDASGAAVSAVGAVAAVAAVAVGFFGAAAALAADATRDALEPAILFDSHPYRADVVGAAAAVPLVVAGRVRADAAPTEFGATFTLDVDEVRVNGQPRATSGAVRIAVGGAFVARQLGEWRAGRRLRATATLSAPLPYRNIGTPDQETRLALAGIRLFGSVKSASQVDVLARGRWWEEAVASVRAVVRRTVAHHVGGRPPPHQSARPAPRLAPTDGPGYGPGESAAAQSAAIATAILIGDRAGLDDDVEERLQRAGTFHIIAISGGNIAILTALVLGLLRLAGFPPRACAAATLVVVIVYAIVVGAGASVARATLAASVYLVARLIDHRTPTVNVLAVVVGIMLVWAPLEIVDPGFWLTCLATLAIVAFTERITERLHRVLPARRLMALLAATMAAEAVLVPVTAYAFYQVSIAGLLLNFIAIPLMTVVQIGGLFVVGAGAAAAVLAPVADLAGRTVHLASRAIVDSARLVDLAPWSASRVAPPPLWLVVASQGCLCAAWWSNPHTWRRRASAIAWIGCLALIASAWPLPFGRVGCELPALPPGFTRDGLRLTLLDVAQGDATLVRLPGDRGAWLIDAGGSIGHYDVGARIVSPALWALGLRRLSTLVLTHGDRDHIGGAAAVLRDFRPATLWEGVPVDGHAELARLKTDAREHGVRWQIVRAGDADQLDGVDVRVWHPPQADWHRTRVRNDDSIVLEIAYRDVSIVLPGDIGAEVERGLASGFNAAAAASRRVIRVLKVPHHGSRTSSTHAFLDALTPRVALVSAGRGNRHGHPAPAVLDRYASRRTTVFRTDRDGAVQLDTDGRALVVRTCSGQRVHDDPTQP